MSARLMDLSISAAGKLIREGSLSPVTLAAYYLDRIAALDGPLHAFNTVVRDKALAAAHAAERQIAAGFWRGPMHGIPYGAKDIYDTAGILTSCQSRLKPDNVPATNAFAVERLEKAGAILIGKSATIEFATGGPTEETLFPPARNPWDLARIPGGSSSGSGAAVAAGFCRMALGSDTGGSIRGPAALCGTVGIKPTYGLVSRRGVHPLSFTLDHCGPLAWTVEDTAISLAAMVGFDPLDPACADVPTPDYAERLGRGVKGLRIGYVARWARAAADIDPEIAAALDAAAAQFEALGAVVEEVALPHDDVFHACGRTILLAECYAIHEKDLVERPELYGRPTRERLMVGAFVRGSDYVEAMRMRRELALMLNNDVLGRYDLLLTPASLKPAGLFSELGDDPLGPLSMTTIPFNVTGNPAMCMPCGFTANGLPMAMQLVGRAFDEATVFQAGHAYEAATEWTARRPALFAPTEALAAE